MWPWYALIAMVCFAAMQLMFAELSRQGTPTAVILLFVFGFATLLYIGHVRALRMPLAIAPRVAALLALIAVLSYVGNLFSVRAVATAPNPGYAVAIVGLQAAAVTIGAVMLSGATLSWVKGLGVLLCSIGIALLVI